MHGTKHLTVSSVNLKFELEFSRNITIFKGDSATGKTTLVDMIQEYVLNGSDTGINLSCECPCRVITGNAWAEQLRDISGSLVFVDEGNRFVASEDFAQAVRRSDNYYVIVTRESLSNLPYSVTEIYGIHSSGKYSHQKPVYHQMYRIYGDHQQPGAAHRLLVEDSNSGYEFFEALSRKNGIDCVSAGGAGNIFNMLQQGDNKAVTVIADGAAFGAQMEKVYQLALKNKNIQLYLPESFEWLILSSGALNDEEVNRMLADPSEYIESSEYFSWENYFTKLLTDKTSDSYLKYSKAKLNPAFLQGRVCEKIIAALPELLRKDLK